MSLVYHASEISSSANLRSIYGTYVYDDLFEVDTSKLGTGRTLNTRQNASGKSKVLANILQSYPLDCDKENESNKVTMLWHLRRI